MRGCNAISKGELLEFCKFADECILIQHTVMKHDPKTGITADTFNQAAFEKMYESFEKTVFVVKLSDQQKIIHKLGEDVYDGVSSKGPDGTRYEDRIEFKEIWAFYHKKFELDGVLHKPFEFVLTDDGAQESLNTTG